MPNRYPPTLWPSKFPEGERDYVWHLSSTINDIAAYIRDFAAALSLFEACRAKLRGETFEAAIEERWRGVAQRDGALTIYHFGRAIEAIRSSMKNTPSVREKANHELLRSANKAFKQKFPNFVEMRHAVSHSADAHTTLEQSQRHSFSGNYESQQIKFDNSQFTRLRNFTVDRIFISTWEGKIITYEMSVATLQAIEEIAQTIYSAFDNLYCQDYSIVSDSTIQR